MRTDPSAAAETVDAFAEDVAVKEEEVEVAAFFLGIGEAMARAMREKPMNEVENFMLTMIEFGIEIER